MGKVDIVKEIFEDLKNNHKNLFHSVEKEVVDKEIEKLISKANSLNDEQFIYELSKIFALFKDAHTRVNFKFEPFENFFCYLNGKVYFKDEKHNFLEVKTICNIEIENLIRMIEPILCYETEEWRDHLIENRLNNINSYKILGLIDKNTQKLDVELQNGEKLELNKFVCKTNYQPKPSYEYRFIGDILYLRYRRCCEDELKFCDFLEQIEKDLNNSTITATLYYNGKNGRERIRGHIQFGRGGHSHQQARCQGGRGRQALLQRKSQVQGDNRRHQKMPRAQTARAGGHGERGKERKTLGNALPRRT